jgi:non-specific serine/threonine protein kinase
MKTREHWQQVEDMFHAALKVEAGKRAEFISQACAYDSELRSDVESLVAAHERTGALIDLPLTDLVPDLAPELQLYAGQLIGHYRVVELIGRGGMGQVYKAEDPKLLRLVAIKVLSKRQYESFGTGARFLREARASSAINHPNIITIYEIGEMPEFAYIVMEYVEGRSLHDLIDTGRLAVGEILQIAAQVSEALAEAHSRKIIHRDIKPDNILITPRGQVKLLDFGIAKPFGQLGSLSDHPALADSLTGSGALVGTPAYMSPEQLRCEPLDERTDIFSFGVVLYGMIAGKHPFSGITAVDVAASILKEQPESLYNISAVASPRLSELVMRCLEKEREKRYASFTQIRRDLKAISDQEAEATASGHLTAARVKAEEARPEPVSVTGASAGPAILVLPFEVISPAEGDPFIGLGLAHAIITSLAKMSGISVLSKGAGTDRARYAGHSPRRLARELGATILLEGEVMLLGEKIEVLTRLIEVESGRVIWGGQYRGSSSDLFKIQNALCEGVAAALKVSTPTEDRSTLLHVAASDVKAFQLYSRGRAFLDRFDVKENIDIAIEMFEEAGELDRKFALPFAGLGEAYWRKYMATLDDAWVRRAIAACDRALVLDPHQAQVHISLGNIYYRTGKIEKAIQEFERAIKLQPLSDDAYKGLGICHQSKGEMQRAISCFEKAIAIRPGYWGNYNNLGICYYTFGDYNSAAEQFRNVIAVQPDNYNGYNNLGAMYCLDGLYEDALVMHKRAIEIHPNEDAYSNLGIEYFYLGRYEEAIESFKTAIELFPANDIFHFNLGDAYLRVGKDREAAEQYEQAARLLTQHLKIRGGNGELHGRLAICEAKLGRAPEALAGIARAKELEPRNATVIYQQAIVHALTGDSEKALKSLASALAQGYSRSHAKCDPNLESLWQTKEFKSLIDENRASREPSRSP